MKRICSVCLIFTLLFSVLTVAPTTVIAGTVSGTWNGIAWDQRDSYWGQTYIGGGTIYDTGCGILSTCNAINYMNGAFPDYSSANAFIMDWANYAHSIGGYNPGSSASGGYRYIMFGTDVSNPPPLQTKYGSTYNFTMPITWTENWNGANYYNGSTWNNIYVNQQATLKSYLANGGVAIAHVPGHFIALVDYDYATDKFLVLDSYDTAARGNAAYDGVEWVSADELSGGRPSLTVGGYCVLGPTNTPYGDVIKQINALPSVITVDNKDAVEAARAAYNALSDSQKDMVTNLEKLEKAETDLKAALVQQEADKAAAKSVEEFINTLPETITINSQTLVELCRSKYNALTATQKSLVSNYSKLEKAEQTLASLLASQEEDKAVAKTVEDLIAVLPDTITQDYKSYVEMCRTKYEELTPAQQQYVTNYAKLQKAEADLSGVLNPPVDMIAVQEVETLIDSLPGTITENQLSLIELCRSKYNALTDAQKALVSNYAKLTEAEQTLDEIFASQAQDKAAAQPVIDLINTIPVTITKDDQTLISLCRTKYSLLPETAKPFVSNYDKLQKAEQDLTALLQKEIDEAAAKGVDTLIAKLPVDITEENKHLVDEAQAAYEALTEAQQLLVTRKGELMTAITAKKVLNLIALINSLPAVITKADADAVAAARQAYDALGTTEQAMITNYNALVLAEETVQNLAIVTYGDINEDGSVNAKDALLVLKVAVGKEVFSSMQKTAAEVDRKEGINAKDALEILKFAVSKIQLFPVEVAQ